MAYSDKLKFYRTYLNYNQKEIAEKLGVSQSTYSRYETGTIEPSVSAIKKLSSYLNVSIDYLLENYSEDCLYDAVDFEYFVMHGKYFLFTREPSLDDRRMISNKVKACFLQNNAGDCKH